MNVLRDAGCSRKLAVPQDAPRNGPLHQILQADGNLANRDDGDKGEAGT